MPTASVSVVFSVRDARQALATTDFLLTGINFIDGDAIDFLSDVFVDSDRRCRRVLVVTARREHRLLLALTGLAINGVFDPSSDGPDKFYEALSSVAAGETYWSPSVPRFFEAEGASSSPYALTPIEKLVLAILGDGCDDGTAARLLFMKPSTVQSIRRTLHGKLGLQHKGDLIRVAAEYGFVRFTHSGVVRPGLLSLIGKCRSGTKIKEHMTNQTGIKDPKIFPGLLGLMQRSQ